MSVLIVLTGLTLQTAVVRVLTVWQTVWMELTELIVLKVPVTATTDSSGGNDRNGSNSSNGGTAVNDGAASINNMTVWMN